jgi:hypothetical protein
MRLYNKARLRDLCISPDGLKIYVSCDMSSQSNTYKGKIVEFTYTGPISVLSINDSLNTYVRNASIQVYPNPASKILYVRSIKNVTNPLHYFIYDGSGKIALKGDSNNDYFSIPIESLAPGIYILKLYNAYSINVSTIKVVVK